MNAPKLLLATLFALAIPVPAQTHGLLARQVADAAMRRWPEGNLSSGHEKQTWQYQEGTLLQGITAVWQLTGDSKYLDYIRKAVDHVVDANGNPVGYNVTDYSQDQILMGRQVQLLCDRTAEARYCKAVQILRDQLKHQPRNASGGFWHKGIYPQQMWLDGLYMTEPFYAGYAATHHEPQDFADIAHQFLLLEQHARDPHTGLLYHGWDESRQQPWANKTTGLSSSFWARGMAWYAMALVDTIPFFPADQPDRPRLIAVLNRLMTAVVRFQDPDTGVWWEVMDRRNGKGNFPEASASCMFVYALDKGVRLGLLPVSFRAAGNRGWEGIRRQFVDTSHGEVSITHIVKGAGLGGTPYRSGTYEYYVGETVVADEPKGIGAFLLAASEAERPLVH